MLCSFIVFRFQATDTQPLVSSEEQVTAPQNPGLLQSTTEPPNHEEAIEAENLKESL